MQLLKLSRHRHLVDRRAGVVGHDVGEQVPQRAAHDEAEGHARCRACRHRAHHHVPKPKVLGAHRF